MADMIVCCTDCEHSFDAMDARCWISSRDDNSLALCPLCNALLRSSRDWAVWNDCNGVFETFPRRAAAEHAIAEQYQGCGASVMPVRVIAEPDEDRWMRHVSEDNHERLYGREQKRRELCERGVA
jgi:hypothetical protein